MRLVFLVPLLLATSLARAQTPQAGQAVEVRDLRAVPRDVADEVQALFNAGAVRRVSGDLTVLPADVIDGDVALMKGQLTVAGRITGRVVAIDANVLVRAGGAIDGPITVIGGSVTALAGSSLPGAVRSYPEPVVVDATPEGIIVRDESEDEQWYRRRMTPRTATRGDLRLVTARTYNRVEGLPLLLGPRAYMNFWWGRATADAMGVLRSADRFELKPENLGHLVRLELQFGGTRGIRLAGRLEDVVTPVEDWHLSDSEVGLGSFLLHRDYRDYYNRHGGSLSAAGFIGDNLLGTITWADELWSTPDARDPWSLLRDNQQWRPNPLFDAGRMHLVRVGIQYDTRNDDADPWSGWFVNGDYEYGVGRITSYAPTSAGTRDPGPTGRTDYDRVFIDVRRYNRVSAEGQLNLRLVVGGWLSGDDLPLQRRFSLGSAGTLPGYPFRQLRPGTDVLHCVASGEGAMRAPSGTPAECERVLLGQVEYRGELGFDFLGLLDQERMRRRLGWGRRAEWVAFADVGRGWLVGTRAGTLQYSAASFPSLSTFRADVGLGLRLDDLGLYIAKSVTDPRTPFNFFARLQPRF